MSGKFKLYFFRLRAFLKYLLCSRSRLYLHSPFVYKFSNEVIHHFGSENEFLKISEIRKQLASNRLVLKEMGLGSELSSSKNKSVSELLRKASIPHHYGSILYRLAGFMQSKNILEIGTCIGVSTLYLAKATDTQVVSLEGNPERAEFAEKNLMQHGFSNVRIIKGLFEETLDKTLAEMPEIDLVYLDGNHTHDATLKYFDIITPYLHSNSLLILDDIHWSPDMEAAWNKIRVHPRVTLSIDLYKMGILFFVDGRKEQEHFILWA